MSDIKAFPSPHQEFTVQGSQVILRGSDGMTLRDYFAANVLQGLMANPNVVVSHAATGWALCNCRPEDIADFCNAQADAMLAERNKEPSK